MAMLVHKCLNERAPEYLITDCCWTGRLYKVVLGYVVLVVRRWKWSFGDRSFAAVAPRVWNSLADAVRNSALSEHSFANELLCIGRGTFDVEFTPLNELIYYYYYYYY